MRRAATLGIAALLLAGACAEDGSGFTGGGDRDCSDFSRRNFPTPPGDPDGLDRDNDGIACES